MLPDDLDTRQQRLWGFHDFSGGRGLEIGPLHHAIVERRHADVRYVDVFDRDGLLRVYDGDPGVDPTLIPETDYPLHDGERVRTIPETVGDERFDWVMASHVVEHVPDLIGWLKQIAEVVNDGGALVLAVPDRRYCFDLHRPGTSVGQLLQAHELGETVPSIRAVYDYRRGHASVQAPSLWRGDIPGYERRIYDLDQVVEWVDQARKGDYVDAHVWTFTPGTFVEQLIELRALGLSEWVIDRFEPTRRNELEFYAVLRRLPRDGVWPEALFANEPAAGNMPDWVAEIVESHRALEIKTAEVARLHAVIEDERAKKRALRERLSKARNRAERAEQRVASLETSWRWRIGGWFTRPARSLRSRRAR